MRNALSRSEWAVRHLRKKPHESADNVAHQPGVLMIQIDGLGYDQLLRAFEKKKLPFLQRLIQRDHYVLRKFYSGLPSTTAAVQAELFYGVKSGLPAVKYYDRLERREVNMLDAEDVDALAARLERHRQGLLQGGTSYSNIYSGGAEEALFCIQTMKLQSIFRGVQLRKILLFFVLYFSKILRIAGLAVLEIGLAIVDFFRGIFARRNPFKELNFILSRIVACTILRELIRVHVKIDIARGMPIIHVNFIGYDEHAHRRGPNSAFALWTLKGIEGAIKDIMYKAMRSEKRDYQIIVYSDHGQEWTVPFEHRHGRSLRQAVREAFRDGPLGDAEFDETFDVVPFYRLSKRRQDVSAFASGRKAPAEEETGSNIVQLTAMGPLGHLYLPVRPGLSEMRRYAGRLVEAGIPLVLYVQHEAVRCTTGKGDGTLAVKAAEVFGTGHPFLREVTRDIEAVCRHAHAGDFVISGWQPRGRPLTFPVENGSHGGPGVCETRGFVILPDTLEAARISCLRALDLRLQVKTILAGRFPSFVPALRRPDKTPEIIKVMSYNIHSCMGMDGKIFPARIARVIGRRSPDIVALQEVDRNMDRTANQDQAYLIGEQLEMQSVFFPLWKQGGGDYGLAILSRYPMQVIRLAPLPCLKSPYATEPRGLMWVRLDTHAGPLHFFNTHLSYLKKEALLQMTHIVNSGVLDALPPAEPVIFCGDLNSSSASATYGLLSRKLIDSQRAAPEATFVSPYPLLRLDYIFHSHHLAPVRVAAIGDWECRLASDHLPVSGLFVHDPEVKAEQLEKEHVHGRVS